MNVAKVSGAVPAVYSNKNKPTLTQQGQYRSNHALNKVKQGSYHDAFDKHEEFDKIIREKLKPTDLSLYDEVAHYPEQSKIRSMFSLSIHV